VKAPYGSWRSPITASRIAEGAVSLGWPQAVGAALYWVEMRPRESGRYVVVRRAPDGTVTDVTPASVNARTLVHEYGGGMYEAFATAAAAGAGGAAEGDASGDESVVFSAFDDQRLYRQDLEDGGGAAGRWSAPRPLTPEPPAPRAFRYADGRVTPDRRRFFSVRERHLADEVVNDLVVLPAGDAGEPTVVASGHDFFSSPRPSPDGRLLAGLCWDHPNMPWDGTELWVAALDEEDRQTAAVRVAGGEEESVVQPLWAPDGGLLFVSDRSGWWNLYRVEPAELAGALAGADAAQDALAPGASHPVARPTAAPGLGAALLPMEAEFAKPQWVFGVQNAVFLPDGRLAAFCTRDGLDRVVVLAPDGGVREPDCELTSIASIVAVGDRLGVVGGGPTVAARVALVDPETGDVETVRSSLAWEPARAYLSMPRAIEFPTAYEPGSVTGPLAEEIARLGGGAAGLAVASDRVEPAAAARRESAAAEDAGPQAVSTAGAAAPAVLTAHALYYAPHNPDVEPAEGELPPLLVISHGGPTSAAESTLSLSIQFWTSRGFAVVDVNYGGSSGHGRAFRDRLKGNWGIVDTIDCINAARYLVARGDADPARLAVRGGSAGGYTTLNALTRHDVFAAGASYFGLADLEMFVAGGTHKFEERYLIGLVGPYPERADVYRERSPIHHVDDIRCPVIVLQGLEDAIVPPAQAEIIVAALRRNRLPHAYLAFEGEQHGFRKAENIVRSLEAELSFYGQVFGFAQADEIEPPEVENLAR
jgi:dipeptidyl aminopeptidase/acylaminoacyl peptidase